MEIYYWIWRRNSVIQIKLNVLQVVFRKMWFEYGNLTKKRWNSGEKNSKQKELHWKGKRWRQQEPCQPIADKTTNGIIRSFSKSFKIASRINNGTNYSHNSNTLWNRFGPDRSNSFVLFSLSTILSSNFNLFILQSFLIDCAIFACVLYFVDQVCCFFVVVFAGFELVRWSGRFVCYRIV